MNKSEKKGEKGANTQEWLNFWEQLGSNSALPNWIGGFIVLVFALILGMAGSREIWKKNQYYEVTFLLNFIEDIKPGTRVRYQGAVIIGEILSVSYGGDRQLLRAKLKKDFHIPKNGSLITVETWGYFGSSFINVEVIPAFRGTEPYQSGDKILIRDTVNSTVAMWQMYDFFSKEEESISQMEQEILEMKRLSNSLQRNSYFQPKHMRIMLNTVTGDVQSILTGVRSAVNASYETFFTFQQYSDNTIENLKKNIALMRAQSQYWNKQFSPDIPFGTGEWLHEENQYYRLLGYSILAKELSRKYKEKPYKILSQE